MKTKKAKNLEQVNDLIKAYIKTRKVLAKAYETDEDHGAYGSLSRAAEKAHRKAMKEMEKALLPTLKLLAKSESMYLLKSGPKDRLEQITIVGVRTPGGFQLLGDR